MIEKIDLSGKNYELNDAIKEYAQKKLGRLDRFLPRQARESAKLEVIFKEVNRENGNKYECEAILVVPGKKIVAADSTMNMMAAIDIVEAKLADQLRRYKETNEPAKGWRARVARFKQGVA